MSSTESRPGDRVDATAGSTAPRHLTTALAIGLGVAVLLRLVALAEYPNIVADEGGWPLSVRQWAREGLVTFDFHTAPGYHLGLGAFYALFPPTLLTGRWVSALLGLLTIFLLYRAARTILGGVRPALVAALLWGISSPATAVSRRALIEPFQLAWSMGLLLSCVSTSPLAPLAVFACTLFLLLTKANAVILLPAFAAAILWGAPDTPGDSRRAKLVALAAGVVATVACFALLRWLDPVEFARGWGDTLGKPMLPTDDAWLRFGRFVLAPSLLAGGLSLLATQAPLLGVTAVAGAALSRRRRALLAPTLWVLLLTPFLLLQVVQTAQYFSLLYPAFALLAAAAVEYGFTSGGSRRAQAAFAIVALLAVEGAGRTAIAMSRARVPERAGVTWLRSQVAADERVLAAPYLLMQLASPGTSFFELERPSFVPTREGLAASGVRWLVVDGREWLAWRPTADSARLEAAMDSCCGPPRYSDEALRIFRVR